MERFFGAKPHEFIMWLLVALARTTIIGELKNTIIRIDQPSWSKRRSRLDRSWSFLLFLKPAAYFIFIRLHKLSDTRIRDSRLLTFHYWLYTCRIIVTLVISSRTGNHLSLSNAKTNSTSFGAVDLDINIIVHPFF